MREIKSLSVSVSQDKEALQAETCITMMAIAKEHGISQKTQKREVLVWQLLRAQNFRAALAAKHAHLPASLEAAREAWWGFVGDYAKLSASDLTTEADIAGVVDVNRSVTWSLGKIRSKLRSVGPQYSLLPRANSGAAASASLRA
jgi:hypothetical protein